MFVYMCIYVYVYVYPLLCGALYTSRVTLRVG